MNKFVTTALAASALLVGALGCAKPTPPLIGHTLASDTVPSCTVHMPSGSLIALYNAPDSGCLALRDLTLDRKLNAHPLVAVWSEPKAHPLCTYANDKRVQTSVYGNDAFAKNVCAQDTASGMTALPWN